MKRAASLALNIVLVVACILTCTDMIQSYRVRRKAEAAFNAFNKFRSPAEGSSFTLSGVEWSKDRSGTLVFGVSTKCHFCTQSAPFFRQLITSVGPHIAVAAVAPEPGLTARATKIK